MKKFYLALLFFLLLHNYFCKAQPPNARVNTIEVIKMAFITRELNLTTDEAQKFWPVYNGYFNEIKQARKDHPNDEIAFDEKVVGIRKKYKDDFKQILNSDDRVNRIFTVENKFRQQLLRELQNRQRFKKFDQQPR